MALISRAVLGQRALAPVLLEAEALSSGWREWAEQRAP